MLDPEPRLQTIGHVRSSLKQLEDAPRQGSEGAPRATLEIGTDVAAGLAGLRVGEELIVLTWFHLARRHVLQTHPRNDPSSPLAGVFSTRSPDRPNPIGLHRVRLIALTVSEHVPALLEVEPLEAIDGTPVIDLKPVWQGADP